MNYDGPQQLKCDAGPTLWHYTSMNDGRVWPIGYCGGACKHETAEEACEHYKQYLLDNARFSTVQEWPKHKCDAAGCNSAATQQATTPGQMHVFCFCDQHADREGLSAAIGVVGESCHS